MSIEYNSNAGFCVDCARQDICTKSFGMLAGYCNTDYTPMYIDTSDDCSACPYKGVETCKSQCMM